MAVKPTSVRLDEELLARLDKLGEAYERSRGWLIADAVKRYLAEEEEFNAKIDEGLRAAEAGELIPHDQVMREMDVLVASLIAKKAAE